jgi:hypothetical protein
MSYIYYFHILLRRHVYFSYPAPKESHIYNSHILPWRHIYFLYNFFLERKFICYKLHVI